ncbi:MAG: hypothetical protein LBC19_11690 [Tannerella sp.]|jgi:hypothetical protein|nr:hypothetical protein [Tannerella sp.]
MNPLTGKRKKKYPLENQKKKSKKLLSLGMYDVAGSDVHHLSVLGETSNIRIPVAAVWGRDNF